MHKFFILLKKQELKTYVLFSAFLKVRFLLKMTVLLARLTDLKTFFSGSLALNTRIGGIYTGVVYFAKSTCIKSSFAGNIDAVKHSKIYLQIFSILEVELFGTNY